MHIINVFFLDRQNQVSFYFSILTFLTRVGYIFLHILILLVGSQFLYLPNSLAENNRSLENFTHRPPSLESEPDDPFLKNRLLQQQIADQLKEKSQPQVPETEQESDAPVDQTPEQATDDSTSIGEEPPRISEKPLPTNPKIKIQKKSAAPIDFSGRLQLTLKRNSILPTPVSEQNSDTLQLFDITSARLQASGEPIPDLEYRLSFEFAGKPKLKDAFLNYILIRDKAEVRLGQYLYQFSNENSTSSRYLQFVEKASISSALKPGRDRGISVRGDLYDKKLFYNIGIYNGTGDETPEHNSGFDFCIRLAAQPLELMDKQNQFWIGASLSTGRRDNENGSSIEVDSGTDSGNSFFKAEIDAKKSFQLTRYAIDAKLVLDNIHLQAEYMSGEYTFSNSVTLTGGYFTAGYFITGESRTIKQGILKKQSVNNSFSTGGFGAWEIALRYAWFNVDQLFFENSGLYDGWDAVDMGKNTNSGVSWSFGVNWYPDVNSRVMLNWITSTISDLTANGKQVTAENAILMRLQLEY